MARQIKWPLSRAYREVKGSGAGPRLDAFEPLSGEAEKPPEPAPSPSIEEAPLGPPAAPQIDSSAAATAPPAPRPLAPALELPPREAPDEVSLGLTKVEGLTNGGGARKASYEFGRTHRTGAREGPGFLSTAGLTNGNGGRTNGGRVNGGRVNGGRVNGGRVNGGRVNGGRVNGNGDGRVNGGRVNGGRVNGGRVNGNGNGRVNGGRVNGNGLLMTQRIQERRKRNTRVLALLIALVVFGLTLVTPLLLSAVFPQPPIVVDGNFGDWAGVPVVPDSVNDTAANADINLVAFAGVSSDRELFFYVQVAQGGRPFAPPAGSRAAESFRLYVDRDRSQATGYLAYGLGIDLVVELVGYDGALRASAIKVYPAFAQDRSDAEAFVSAGALRVVARGNQIEGSVPLAQFGMSAAAPTPYLLLESADSNGILDLGDAVFSSRPGLLVLRQSPTNATVLPSDRDVLLLNVSAHALHQNLTLEALTLSVDGSGGGGVTVAYALAGGANVTVNASGGAGGTVRVDLRAAGLVFAPGAAEGEIALFGRATGAPGAASVRVALNGTQFVGMAAPPPTLSGHGSIFPPDRFERAYVQGAPDRIVIDGAFADWEPLGPPASDPDNDLLQGLPPTPVNFTPPAGPVDNNIDLRGANADTNTGPAEVSFYLAVDGSIFPARLPPLPAYPSPTQPAGGGGSGGGGGAPAGGGVDGNLATLYVDTDLDPTTGWLALPGMGIDAVVQVVGTGGAMGRAAHTAAAFVSHWIPSTGTFDRTNATVQVGLSSSKMESQVGSLDLCGGPCGRVRYAYAFQNRVGAFDLVGPLNGGLRGDGQALAFDEQAPVRLAANWGDRNVPALAFTLSSPPTNTRIAQLAALLTRFSGVQMADITRIAIYRDSGTRGVLDGTDISSGAVAEATLEPGLVARLVPYTAILFSPGDRFEGIVAVDLSSAPTARAFLNSSSADIFGVRATGIVDTRYGAPLNRTPVNITSGALTRGQNDLVVNEVNFVNGYIEFWDTGGAVTNLTSPSILGFTVYRTNNNGNNVRTVDIRRLTGSTNAEGFAIYNYSAPLSTATIKYYVGLWCSNCTAGQSSTGNNNATYIDYVQLPRSTSNGSFGRFPDGAAVPQNTTNDTSGDNNKAPPCGQNCTVPSLQNNLILNEVNINASWVEVFAVQGNTTNLASPSTMGIEVYYTNNGGGGANTVAVRVFSGNTSSSGFAAINVSVPLSTATRRYHVALWCGNCTAGQDFRGRNNRTYMDDVEIPRSTAVGAWGRYPDADDDFQNTTNNTRAAPNGIPEFEDLVLPMGGLLIAGFAVRRRRPVDEAASAVAPHPRF